MKGPVVRAALAVVVTIYVLTHFFGHAHAANPLGIGSSEPVIAPGGAFSGLLGWINQEQQAFYRALTGALKAMREEGSGAWTMAGLSFAYGIFHAAGPGHGKAVISSYMLANEVALRRGVALSFLSAFLQALTAILVITLMLFLLRSSSISMADATRFLEIASYALISAFGAWLLWRKARPLFGAERTSRSWSAEANAGRRDKHGHSHAAGDVCQACGHAHLPDPALLGGDRLDRKTAWTAVTAVGLRPCSGALIVLTFAFLNGLWMGGVVSVLAMAVGTAITVSLLATLAVGAKNAALSMAGGGSVGGRIHAAIEIAGAGLVLLLGLVLLTASLSA